ncbi:hypothetical protein ACAF76_018170 [Brevibacillus sp. TJ4]|uniref:hypothetical protein n=1 Tax=Brevibacillus sp. TJ4 TaxID=3234853 RepID=UPI003BA0C63E
MKAFDYYGRYHFVPKTIEMLLEFETKLSKSGYSLDRELGLIMEQEDIRYMSTPPDVIPFARAGVDGIHYGFLTDFGSVEDLEQAFIVCVSPMDFGNEVWLVAKNIHDFLRVVYSENSILYNHFSDVDSYIRYIENKPFEEPDEKKRYVMETLKETFSLEPIDDMPQYVRDLHTHRKQAIAVSTLNHLGVVQISPVQQHERFDFESADVGDIEMVRSFFTRVSLESKFAFIREAQAKHCFEDAELRDFACKELHAIGLVDEAKRLELSYT